MNHNKLLPYAEIATRWCQCGCNKLILNVLSDVDYPAYGVWWVARVMCPNCKCGSSKARCSDQYAAASEAVRMWNAGTVMTEYSLRV